MAKKRRKSDSSGQAAIAKQFAEAKKSEDQSWLDNEVFDLVDVRKMKVKNYVSGRWVLTIKRDKEGNFVKCKARWVLRGFQDSQRYTQQTDSPPLLGQVSVSPFSRQHVTIGTSIIWT